MSVGFLIGSNATEVQIDVVLFSSKVMAHLCCLQGFAISKKKKKSKLLMMFSLAGRCR